VLLAFKQSVAVFIPGDPGILQGFLSRGPKLFEEGKVAAYLPVAVKIDEAAELAVSRRFEVPVFFTKRKTGPEDHGAIRFDVYQKISLAHGTLQLGEKKGQALSIVPDVGAVERAATGAVAAALKGKEAAVVKPEAGWGADDRSLAGNCIQNIGW
jgi:hypothetical protein